MTMTSSGTNFRQAVADEKPLQVIGAINAYTARMPEATGFQAPYMSGVRPPARTQKFRCLVGPG